MEAREILATRLATQRLTGPAADGPEQVVGELLAVQAQDAPLARLAVAQRCDSNVDAVAAALDAGRIVRTHVLRPTWHLVGADDLPWLLELCGPRVLSGAASRHRALGLTPEVTGAALDELTGALASGPLTRKELQAGLVDAAVLPADDQLGPRVTHVLMMAESTALIASGPLRHGEHTYRLWGVAPPGRSREDAAAELTLRFFAGHGPASVRDLMRWVNLNKSDITRVIAALGDRLVAIPGDPAPLYFAPDAALPQTRPERALLLSTFDEAHLSYRDVPWPRPAGHPLQDAPYRWSEAGGGVVIDALADAGSWRRTIKDGRLTVRLDLAGSLSDAARRRIAQATAEVAGLLAPEAELMVEEGPVPWGVRSPRSLSATRS